MAVVLNARGQMQLLSAQLAATQHAERSARIVNQIKGLNSLAEKPVPVARLGGGNFDKAGDTFGVQDSIDPKGKSDVEAKSVHEPNNEIPRFL